MTRWLLLALMLMTQLASAQELTQPGSRGVLWEVKGKTGTAFVLARIHVLDPATYPLHPRLQLIFNRCDALAVEMNLSDPKSIQQAQKLYSQAGRWPRGDSLEHHVSAATYADVQAAMHTLRVDPNELDRDRPWLASELLTEMELRSAGFDPKNILELPFVKLAQGSKEIVEILPVTDRIRLSESFPPDQYERLFRAAAQETLQATEDFQSLESAWRTGYADTLAQADRKILDRHPEAKAATLRFRKEHATVAARYIADFVDSGRKVFVILDAQWLLGDEGAIAMLRSKGYIVSAR